MTTEIKYTPILEKNWGRFRPNYHEIGDFSETLKMSENDFYLWSNHNGLMAGDVDRKILREVTGSFLGTNILALCHGLSSQRFGIRPSTVIVGSAAYKTLSKQLDHYGWYYEMTGLNRMGPEKNEVKDLDIWIPRQTMLHLSKIGFEFTQTRSNPEVVIATVENGDAKVQIHSLKHHDLNPLFATSFMSHTDVMATAIVLDGPDIYFIDPFAALQKGPWNQEFPKRLLDPENFLLKNNPRVVMSAMIWAISTPFFPDGGIEDEPLVRSFISDKIRRLDLKAVQAIDDRYTSPSSNSPYCDELFKLSTAYNVAKLAKVGVLPDLLFAARKYNLYNLSTTLIHSIGLFIANMNELEDKISANLPEIDHEHCDQAILSGDFTNLEHQISEIDWEAIVKMTLPKINSN